MKSISGVLPWAVVVALIAGTIWWMLTKEMAGGRWLLAAALVGHGAVHLLFAVSEPEANGAEWPFDMARSWAITGINLNPSLVRAVGWVLIAITVAGLALAALSTVGIAVPSEWWRPAVGFSAIVSVLVLVLFYNSQMILGIGINAALIGIAAAGLWVP